MASASSGAASERWNMNMHAPGYMVGDEEQRAEGGVTPIREKRPGVRLTGYRGWGHLSQLRRPRTLRVTER